MSRHARGITLIEVMLSMVVLLLGVTAALMVVRQTTESNRRTLTALQAQLIAEQALENITAMGCTANPPCGNLAAQDNRRYTVWQTSAGELREVAPPADVIAREYEVAVDVDSGAIPGSIESGSVGAPAVNRDLVNGVAGSVGNIANVRVSVSWREQERNERQVVVLQTRVAP
ncbi:prepilin-type N-terminal cleavage/methylation domain-containing protein [Myxococcus sp. RHSTA-1-4]|uniref:prepilin-type N-terminal cleavage/methylation domain-containing protein n=1 Tax=Myxococcus sp. RHSTA-1-4 TaxID=2874601 RepID=UPI001CBD131F|nr:prepilin-type N-terminal cleavage/methylation domain-containing protein [Myxococcus sp. RHSTA-1-4]MBZ4420814.1 prepilin-type N-terminal cleavage/methylation domain-containing protein [Myxococcus sp. RHSTA-1-4]